MTNPTTRVTITEGGKTVYFRSDRIDGYAPLPQVEEARRG